jgi:hypothetical protein
MQVGLLKDCMGSNLFGFRSNKRLTLFHLPFVNMPEYNLNARPRKLVWSSGTSIEWAVGE